VNPQEDPQSADSGDMATEPGAHELVELRSAQAAAVVLWEELQRDLAGPTDAISLDGNEMGKADFESRCFALGHQLSELEDRCRVLAKSNLRMSDAAGACSDLRVALGYLLNLGLAFIGESSASAEVEIARHRQLYLDAYHEFEQRLEVLQQQE
jgi:hypothetical protein